MGFGSSPNIVNPSRVQENPYVMRKDNYQDFQGNDQYEGFCVDMLREVADILKFSFKIKLVDDGLYGAPEPNGSWTGMVGELINRVSTLPQPLSVSHQTLKKKKKKMVCTERKTLIKTHTHLCSPKPRVCCNLPCLKLPSERSKTLI